MSVTLVMQGDSGGQLHVHRLFLMDVQTNQRSIDDSDRDHETRLL